MRQAWRVARKCNQFGCGGQVGDLAVRVLYTPRQGKYSLNGKGVAGDCESERSRRQHASRRGRSPLLSTIYRADPSGVAHTKEPPEFPGRLRTNSLMLSVRRQEPPYMEPCVRWLRGLRAVPAAYSILRAKSPTLHVRHRPGSQGRPRTGRVQVGCPGVTLGNRAHRFLLMHALICGVPAQVTTCRRRVIGLSSNK